MDDPDEDGENWYYFRKQGVKSCWRDSKKSMAKTYYFDEDGKRWSMAGTVMVQMYII